MEQKKQLFSPEWAVINPEKIQRARCTRCKCNLLHKELQEKDQNQNELETKMSKLQNRLDEYILKEIDQHEKFMKLKETNEEYLKLLSEYDSLVSDIIKERDIFKSEKYLIEIHLANLEFTFSDVHTKFERAKTVVDGFRKNEEVLVEALSENETSITELQRRYNTLKETTEMQLQEANEMFNKMKDEHENELKRRDTKIKRQEIEINSLNHCLQQKRIENEELIMVCDEFIDNQKRNF